MLGRGPARSRVPAAGGLAVRYRLLWLQTPPLRPVTSRFGFRDRVQLKVIPGKEKFISIKHFCTAGPRLEVAWHHPARVGLIENMNDAHGCCTKCPICRLDCDITEEDIIYADCGACGPVNIHVHCKEKYCRQQGLNAVPGCSFLEHFLLY